MGGQRNIEVGCLQSQRHVLENSSIGVVLVISSRTWRWRGTFVSLRNRDFRWLWLGGLASSATFQMGTVAQGWLVYQLTGSAFALGWVGAGWSVSALVLSLFGGAISDRVEKRDLLLWTRAGMVLSSLVLAVLMSTDAIRIWHLAASSLFNGVLFSFMMPAQQAMLAELVDRRTLLNAISLSSIGMGLMGIVAASLAGLMIEFAGVDSVYYAMAALYIWALFALSRLPATGPAHIGTTSVWSDLKEGVRYLGVSPAVAAVLGLSLARVLFAMPYGTLMPKFAKDVLGFEATGLGVLMAAPGIGSLISSLVVASLGDFRRKGRLLLAGGVAMGVSLVLFASASQLLLAILFLVFVGGSGNICMVVNQTLLQVDCDDQFRGRVMSMYMMMWGLTPLGTIPAGAAADRVGVPLVVGLQGGLLAAIFLGVWLLRPRIRRLE